jgi:uncharacterized protein YbbK (DUF523 family)
MASPDSTQPIILASACLVDMQCRYNGSAAHLQQLDAARASGRLIPLCPEVAGGLGVPREPAAIVGGTGGDVLDGKAQVITRSGRDVTREFIRGAELVTALARSQGVTIAVLKSRSPSCGSRDIYHAEGHLVPGEGVLSALLRRHGIQVISDEEWDEKWDEKWSSTDR